MAETRDPSAGGGRRKGKVVPIRPQAGAAAVDDTDRALLRALQANARATYTELGRAVGLSAAAAHERVHRLERQGVLRGYHAEVDPALLGRDILALVHVLPSDFANAGATEAALQQVEQIEAAYAVAGEESHVLLVRTGSIAELSDVLQRLQDIDGIARTRTSIVLSTPVRRHTPP